VRKPQLVRLIKVNIVRRGAAFLLDAALLGAASRLGLWWDSQTQWLYGYDGVYLGTTLLILGYIGCECLVFSSPGKALFRLRITHESGGPPYRLQVLYRGLLFWFAITGSLSYIPADLAQHFGFETRSLFMLTFATLFSIVFLTGVSVATSTGDSGIHDLLSCTKVLPRSEFVCRRQSERLIRILPSRAIWSTGCVLWVLCLTATLYVDWKGRISEAVAGLVKQKPFYVSSRLTPLMIDPLASMTLGFSTEDNYIDYERKVVLVGRTEYYQFPAPTSVINNHSQRWTYAIQSLIGVVPNSLPSTKWIHVELFAYQGFGYALRKETVGFIYDYEKGTFRYAPIGQRVYRSKIAPDTRSSDSTRIDSIITYFKPRVESETVLFVGVGLGWRFPSLNFAQSPILPLPD
jgi:uncharacterized RDD family membrane protein YckC